MNAIKALQLQMTLEIFFIAFQDGIQNLIDKRNIALRIHKRKETVECSHK